MGLRFHILPMGFFCQDRFRIGCPFLAGSVRRYVRQSGIMPANLHVPLKLRGSVQQILACKEGIRTVS